MSFENRLQIVMIWGVSFVCFSVGLYLALEHTVSFFAIHNYLFAPLGDEVVDAATAVYPIHPDLLG